MLVIFSYRILLILNIEKNGYEGNIKLTFSNGFGISLFWNCSREIFFSGILWTDKIEFELHNSKKPSNFFELCSWFRCRLVGGFQLHTHETDVFIKEFKQSNWLFCTFSLSFLHDTSFHLINCYLNRTI